MKVIGVLMRIFFICMILIIKNFEKAIIEGLNGDIRSHFWRRPRCVDHYAINIMGKKFMHTLYFDPVETVYTPSGLCEMTDIDKAIGIEVWSDDFSRKCVRTTHHYLVYTLGKNEVLGFTFQFRSCRTIRLCLWLVEQRWGNCYGSYKNDCAWLEISFRFIQKRKGVCWISSKKWFSSHVSCWIG